MKKRVGKTSLIHQYANKEFINQKSSGKKTKIKKSM
jgi:GTPase SAR1 family protein